MSHRTFELCSTLGIRVIKVDEPLPRPVMFCGVSRIAFVDATISPADLRGPASWLLSQALRAER